MSFTSKARPSAAAAASSQAVLSLCAARAIHSIASTISAIITASIVSLRDVITSIGRKASTSAAASAARTFQMRRTAA